MDKELIIDTIKKLSKNERKFISQYKLDPVKWQQYKDKYELISEFALEEFPDNTINEVMSLVVKGYTTSPRCPGCGASLTLDANYKPHKYCSTNCRFICQGANNSTPVEIDGVTFKNIKDAFTTLGLPRWEVINNLMDCSKPTWKFVGDHNQICIVKLKDTHPKLADEIYLKEWKASGESMKVLCEKLGIESHATLKHGLLFFGIDTTFDQKKKYI